jgi:hypothetical protein
VSVISGQLFVLDVAHFSNQLQLKLAAQKLTWSFLITDN